MKIIPAQFVCEGCNNTYATKAEALECESKKPPMYPYGMIFGNPHKERFYANITFAIAVPAVYCHMNDSAMWACRDNGNGDSLGDKTCGGLDLSLDKNDVPDPDHPTFKRLVKYLESIDVQITVWDGEKPVPLHNFINEHRKVKP